MEKIPVIYWSGTGNTKLMAEAVAEGIGTAAELKSVSDITPEQAAEYSALALGCSAMGAEVLEEYEFEPFFTALEPFLQGKKVVIFGSYGWGGQSIALVQKELEEAGLNIFHDMIRIANQPTQEELDNIYNSIIENFKI